jgi:hypothetical protein
VNDELDHYDDYDLRYGCMVCFQRIDTGDDIDPGDPDVDGDLEQAIHMHKACSKLCDQCGNIGASLAPHSGKVLCDCCMISGLIGPHECVSHRPAGSFQSVRVLSSCLPLVAPEPLGGDRPTAGKVTPKNAPKDAT